MSHPRSVFDPSLLAKAIEKFNEFTQQYESIQDHYPIEKFPTTTVTGLNALAEHPEIGKIIEAELIRLHLSLFSKKIVQLLDWIPEEEILMGGRKRHFFSFMSVPLLLFKIGQSQELTSLLIIDLMKINVPEIHIVFFNGKTELGLNYEYFYLILLDGNKNEYVFDPFFKIHCTADQYIQHKKVFNYFSKITGISDWSLDKMQPQRRSFLLSNGGYPLDEIMLDLEFFKKKIDGSEELLWIQRIKQLRHASSKDQLDALLPEWLEKMRAHCMQEPMNHQQLLISEFKRFTEKLEKRGVLTYQSTRDLDYFSGEIRLINQGRRFDVFLDCIEEKKWGSALRTACTSHQHGLLLIQMMQQYPRLFSLPDLILELNKDGDSAFHIAASKGNEVVFNLLKQILIQSQKSIEELNGEGKSAGEIRHEFYLKEYVPLFNPELSQTKWRSKKTYEINSSTQEKDVKRLKWDDHLLYLKNPTQVVVRAIPKYANLLIGSETTKSAIEWLKPEFILHVANPTREVVEAIPDQCSLLVSECTTVEAIGYLKMKKFRVLLVDPAEHALRALPKTCFLIVAGFTAMKVAKMLEPNKLVFFEDPTKQFVRSLPKGLRVVLNSLTTKEEIQWIADKDFLIFFMKLKREVLKEIPLYTRIDMSITKIDEESMAILKDRRCRFECLGVAHNKVLPVKASNAVLKSNQNDKKNKKPFIKKEKEVPFSELKNYFDEIKKKLDRKGGLISHIMESPQALCLFLKKSIEKQNVPIALITQLKQISKISCESGISANFIKIDAWISRDDFNRAQTLLNAYEEKEIEIATQDEKKNLLNAFQNKIQNKGYDLKIESIEESWRVTFESGMLEGAGGSKMISDLKKIEEAKEIEIQGAQLILPSHLTLENFNLLREALNGYGESLKKKSILENIKADPALKPQEKQFKEPFDYAALSEKPKPKKPSHAHSKKKPKVNKAQGSVSVSTVSVNNKQNRVPYFPNPTYVLPSSPALSLEERLARDRLKQREENQATSSESYSCSSSYSSSSSSSSATSSTASLGRVSLFAESNAETGKKVHCVYNGGQSVESFIYPEHFASSMAELRYVLKTNEILRNLAGEEASYANLYGMIQLLELTQKLFELQKSENKKYIFSSRILDIGLVITLRQRLKPECILEYKSQGEVFSKFIKKMGEFRKKLMENLSDLISGYENEFERNETLQLESMKAYTDQFHGMFEKLSAPSLIQFKQFSQNQKQPLELQLKDLIQYYDELVCKRESIQDLAEKSVNENELKYVIIALSDLSEKAYPQDKNALLGLIGIRNRFMHVMESEGDQAIRNLAQDQHCLKDREMLASIEFIKSKYKPINAMSKNA